MKFYDATVREVKRETTDSVTITLNVPADYPPFKAGQYFSVDAPVEGGPVRRSYSFGSAPSEGIIRYTVKRTEAGYISVFFNTVVKEGQALRISEPQGHFTMPAFSGPRHLVFFAAGSGITPIRSLMVEALTTEPGSRITLFYGNKNREDVIFGNELQAWADANPNVKVVFIYSRQDTDSPVLHGRITFGKTLELVHSFCRDAMWKEFFICGPGEMIESVKNALVDIGIQTDRIHTEYFSTPVAKSPSGSESASQEGVAKSRVTAILDGDEISFDWTPGQPRILDSLLDMGADAPYSCKGGVCSSCKAKLIEGQVTMDANYSLTDKEVQKGYILTCQSKPASEVVRLTYDGI